MRTIHGITLDAFTLAYIQCALWSETDNAETCPDCEGEGVIERLPYHPDLGEPSEDVCASCGGCGRVDDPDSNGGEPFDSNFSIDDIHADSLKRIVEDCERFQSANADDIDTIPSWVGAADSSGRSWYSGVERAGHDFWFTRNGHGVGFWDRDDVADDVKERLTKASKAFGECSLYLGDDGKIHVTGGR